MSETSINLPVIECQSQSAQESMLRSIEAFKVKLDTKISNATLLAVLQKEPCLVKCVADINSPSYGGDVDQLYIAKHDFARITLLDRIACEFCGGFEIGAERVTRTGKLDVSIANSRIILGNGGKTIGIEVKTGQGGLDVFQLVRYLFDVDKLIVMRVATADVVVITKLDVIGELERAATAIQGKITQIISNRQYKVEGPWCFDCKAECEYRKKRSTSPHVASMEGLTDFINNVGISVEKTMVILRKELAA